MKLYHLYVFTQDKCAPCIRLHDYIDTLTQDERAEIDLVPLKEPTGGITSLAQSFEVELSPTLVVCHETVSCQIDKEGFEDCDLVEEIVEKFVGASNIIEHLDATLDAYTYAHPPE